MIATNVNKKVKRASESHEEQVPRVYVSHFNLVACIMRILSRQKLRDLTEWEQSVINEITDTHVCITHTCISRSLEGPWLHVSCGSMNVAISQIAVEISMIKHILKSLTCVNASENFRRKWLFEAVTMARFQTCDTVYLPLNRSLRGIRGEIVRVLMELHNGGIVKWLL